MNDDLSPDGKLILEPGIFGSASKIIEPSEDRIFLPTPVAVRPLDEVLGEIFDKFNTPRLGGVSKGRGWSSWASLQKCFYYYKLKYIEKKEVANNGYGSGTPNALAVGSLFHTFSAVMCQKMIDPNYALTPSIVFNELINLNTYVEPVTEAWRIFTAYLNHYPNDYLTPLSIEESFVNKEGNSCRYDMVATVKTPQPGIPSGTYIIEHKTASRFDQSTLEGWANDGEIIGEMLLWKDNHLDKQFGKLQGVMINLVGKQKTPQFARIIIPVQLWQLKQHANDLKIWRSLEQLAIANDIFPHSRSGCLNRYGKCQYWDHCTDGAKLVNITQPIKPIKPTKK